MTSESPHTETGDESKCRSLMRPGQELINSHRITKVQVNRKRSLGLPTMSPCQGLTDFSLDGVFCEPARFSGERQG